jgi:hypothetical protein
MGTMTRKAAQVKPVHGTCRVVLWSPETEGIIEIDDVPYWLKLLHDGGKLVGVRLSKFASEKV